MFFINNDQNCDKIPLYRKTNNSFDSDEKEEKEGERDSGSKGGDSEEKVEDEFTELMQILESEKKIVKGNERKMVEEGYELNGVDSETSTSYMFFVIDA